MTWKAAKAICMIIILTIIRSYIKLIFWGITWKAAKAICMIIILTLIRSYIKFHRKIRLIKHNVRMAFIHCSRSIKKIPSFHFFSPYRSSVPPSWEGPSPGDRLGAQCSPGSWNRRTVPLSQPGPTVRRGKMRKTPNVNSLLSMHSV